MSKRLSRKEYLRRKIRRRRALAWTILIVALAISVLFSVIAINAIIKSFTRDRDENEPVITEAPIETPTPTPTSIPIDGLVRRDPKEDHYLVLKITASYEKSVTEVNVRRGPKKESGLVTTVNVGDTFNISCYYTDPDNSNFIGLNAGEIGVPGSVVWISKQYCKVSEIIQPWAVNSGDHPYHQKYGQAKVTIRNLNGDTDPNLRSEPWESEGSAYGRVASGTVIKVSSVQVSDDQQWYGFPAGAFADEVSFYDAVRKDPDGLVWVYQAYCVINPLSQ